MTLGDLAELLAELEEDKQRVADAQRALEHGGDENTMRIKRNALAEAQRMLAYTSQRWIGN